MFGKLKWFKVYLNNKLIDEIPYSQWSKVTCADVRKSLVEHDGYDPNIVVKYRKWSSC